MFQMQHNAYVQQQHSKDRVDGDDQHIKKEEDDSSQLENSDDWPIIVSREGNLQ